MDEIDKKTGLHWQSRRVADRKALKEHADLLIDRLLALRDESDPRTTNGNDKDAMAFEALRVVGDLVDCLSGWAIDHQVGLALKGLEFVPRPPQEVRQLSDYGTAKAAVDSHEHEFKGVEHRGKLLPPDVQRKVAINLLRANPGAFPGSVANGLEQGLRALEINDVLPILQSTPAGRKVEYRERILQLRALGFAQFRKATGLMTLAEGYEEVARAYGGVDAETIRHWEARLREDIGAVAVSAEIRFAKNAGSYIQKLKSERGRAWAQLEDDYNYGKAALALAADEYRKRGQKKRTRSAG